MQLGFLVIELERLMVLAELLVLDAQITELGSQRDAAGVELWDRVKRVRTGVKSVFGDDSSE